MTHTRTILIIVTNVGEYQKVGYRTGLWLGELTHFWDVAEKAGYAMDIASPSGGHVPLDPESLIISELAQTVGIKGDISKRYEDRTFMNLLDNTPAVSKADPSAYDAIYLTGATARCSTFRTAKLFRPSSPSPTKKTRSYRPSAMVQADCST